MKKILAFDSWTEGARHFQRLLPAFESAGLSLKLVHIGSWGNDPGRPRQELLGGLPVCDISAYPGESFERVLEVEKPDAVLLLSTATFAHRAFLRYCKKKSIPSLHLFHGFMSVSFTEGHRGSVNISGLAHARFVLGKLAKLIRKTLPYYLWSLARTGAGISEWMRFAYDAAKLAAGFPIWQPNVAPDASTTRCAIFTDVDREYAHRAYRVPLVGITAVGNPDLIWFGLSEGMLARYGRPAAVAGQEEVMYLDTGLVTVGWIFQNVAEYASYLGRTADALRQQGFRMSMKPHPAHDLETLRKLLVSHGIEIVGKNELLSRLRQCAACIVEMTSISLIPALMGIPLLYPNFGPLENLRYGPLLTGYPRGHLLRRISDARAALDGICARKDDDTLRDWIRINAGPLPAEDMPKRVAAIIEEMISGSAVSDRRK